MFDRHARHAEATRRAVRAWDLEVLSLDEREHSASLTAVVVPDGHDADEVRRLILERYDSRSARASGGSPAASSASGTSATSTT